MHWYGHHKGKGPEPKAPRGRARRAQDHDLRTAGFRKAFFGLGTYEYPRAPEPPCPACGGRPEMTPQRECTACGASDPNQWSYE